MVQWLPCCFLAGEDLNIKFCRRPVCTGKHITQQGFQGTSYKTRTAWTTFYQDDTSKKRLLRCYMLENRKSDYYLIKGLIPSFQHSPFCPQHELPHACLCKTRDRHWNPPDGYWKVAACFLFWCGLVPRLAIAFALSTQHKREICLKILLKVIKFCGGWLSPRQEVSLIPRLYWVFHHLQSSDHVLLFLIQPS